MAPALWVQAAHTQVVPRGSVRGIRWTAIGVMGRVLTYGQKLVSLGMLYQMALDFILEPAPTLHAAFVAMAVFTFFMTHWTFISMIINVVFVAGFFLRSMHPHLGFCGPALILAILALCVLGLQLLQCCCEDDEEEEKGDEKKSK
uniref:Uncharacterized protein n=1 Tax=Pyrodinium bahamense TaxID=73915 RepID=A0A7S0AB00_9DINO